MLSLSFFFHFIVSCGDFAPPRRWLGYENRPRASRSSALCLPKTCLETWPTHAETRRRSFRISQRYWSGPRPDTFMISLVLLCLSSFCVLLSYAGKLDSSFGTKLIQRSQLACSIWLSKPPFVRSATHSWHWQLVRERTIVQFIYLYRKCKRSAAWSSNNVTCMH